MDAVLLFGSTFLATAGGIMMGSGVPPRWYPARLCVSASCLCDAWRAGLSANGGNEIKCMIPKQLKQLQQLKKCQGKIPG